MDWLVIATWDSPVVGVREAARVLRDGGDAKDAVEAVARMEEENPDNHTVGFGGFPNRNGEVQLDAAFMDGRDLSIGSVAAVEGYRDPVRIARRLMTGSPHTMLVGRGAEDFASANGFRRSILLTDEMRRAWEERASREADAGPVGHDTVGAVALDRNGRMAVAASTSGMGMKHRGRVGDTPLVGSGFYVDDEVGGAAATGLGEDIMRGCLCFLAVELMRQGLPPQRAAEEAVLRVHGRLASSRGKVGSIAMVCADVRGRFGGAANHEGFSFSVSTSEMEPVVVPVVPVVRAG